MNPVPTPPSENDAFPTQHGWNGVNVLNPDPRLSEERRRQESKIFRIGVNLPEGQRPKGTEVSPWYGVYIFLRSFF